MSSRARATKPEIKGSDCDAEFLVQLQEEEEEHFNKYSSFQGQIVIKETLKSNINMITVFTSVS